jgi:hypothetical protein
VKDLSVSRRLVEELGFKRLGAIWYGRREEALTCENPIFMGFLACCCTQRVQQGCAAGQGRFPDMSPADIDPMGVKPS